MTGERVEYAPYQEVAALFPHIPHEAFRTSLQLVETDGSVYVGAEAVFRSLTYAAAGGWLLWMYRHVPLFAPLTEACYRLVAAHRVGFSRLTRWLWGESVEKPNYLLVRWTYLRLLGLIFLVAFVSFGIQAKGLVGPHGILPAGKTLERAASVFGAERYARFPTLSWLMTEDGGIDFLWAGGAALSLLLILDVAPGPVLVLLWAFYLSIATLSGVFLEFQWDILLLETAFLSIFMAPWKLLPGIHRDTHPSRAALWLLRFLLFRLMFASGVVKLASGDATWWNLTALNIHFETQPLPTWIGWYAHQLPGGLLRIATGLMFVIELVVPFLIFLPRRPRLFAFLAFVVFQALIALTGNYCYFNLLTVTLSVLLLDDTLIARFFPPGMAAQSEAPRRPGFSRYPRRVAVGLVCVAMLPLECMALSRCLRRPLAFPQALERWQEEVYPFRVVAGYGLFSRMTTTRREIIVEGSMDGQSWLPYEFKWKPGDLMRRPSFVAPHQPRVDWQMWFAALGSWQSNPWFQSFIVRLLQGSPDVLAMLAKNPFPDSPPRYLRAELYQYRFTTLAEKKESGAWWRRELLGHYCPPIALKRE